MHVHQTFPNMPRSTQPRWRHVYRAQRKARIKTFPNMCRSTQRRVCGTCITHWSINAWSRNRGCAACSLNFSQTANINGYGGENKRRPSQTAKCRARVQYTRHMHAWCKHSYTDPTSRILSRPPGPSNRAASISRGYPHDSAHANARVRTHGGLRRQAGCLWTHMQTASSPSSSGSMLTWSPNLVLQLVRRTCQGLLGS